MSEMIERVARALCFKHSSCRCDPGHCHKKHYGQDWHEDDARAAIAAMREPTFPMTLACEVECKSWWTRDRSTPIYGHEPGYLWRAMIDAALAKVE